MIEPASVAVSVRIRSWQPVDIAEMMAWHSEYNYLA
jgi:hypothetical protein